MCVSVQFRLFSLFSINNSFFYNYKSPASLTSSILKFDDKFDAKWRFQPSILQCFAPVPAQLWRFPAMTSGTADPPVFWFPTTNLKNQHSEALEIKGLVPDRNYSLGKTWKITWKIIFHNPSIHIEVAARPSAVGSASPSCSRSVQSSSLAAQLTSSDLKGSFWEVTSRNLQKLWFPRNCLKKINSVTQSIKKCFCGARNPKISAFLLSSLSWQLIDWLMLIDWLCFQHDNHPTWLMIPLDDWHMTMSPW